MKTRMFTFLEISLSELMKIRFQEHSLECLPCHDLQLIHLLLARNIYEKRGVYVPFLIDSLGGSNKSNVEPVLSRSFSICSLYYLSLLYIHTYIHMYITYIHYDIKIYCVGIYIYLFGANVSYRQHNV